MRFLFINKKVKGYDLDLMALKGHEINKMIIYVNVVLIYVNNIEKKIFKY